jgi:hypothetical protein
VRFFFDENIAPALVESLQSLSQREYPDDTLISYSRRFPRGTKDAIWLPQLAKEEDLIIVSGDVRISRSPHEQAAWLQAGMTTFFLAKGWMNRKFWEQAEHLVKVWPALRREAERAKPGSGYLVRANDHIDQLRNLPDVPVKKPSHLPSA